MEKVDWTVEGMTCSNCALTVSQYLKNEGAEEVKVNPINGKVSFLRPDDKGPDHLAKGIHSLGYAVAGSDNRGKRISFLGNNTSRFFFCLPFTLVLMLHMLDGWLHIHWLMNPWVQMALCLPVFIVGMLYFGRSAVKSILNGVPNMNVLISIGAIASFAYSLAGAVLQLGPDYLFFETTASIITLVFLGNYLEERAINSTQRSVQKLARSTKVMANMIAFDDEHNEVIMPVENSSLRQGDLVLIKSGEQVPADCKILWGDCAVSEAIITGESIPLNKQKGDHIIGGSVVESGTIKAIVTAAGESTVLSGIVHMVEKAQGEKPPVQKLADKISAVFVPVVLVIALATFLINFFAADHTFATSLMRSVAVLVIACPCAMGLATPAAIAVGLGRAARNGILFRDAGRLEDFRKIKQVVFDKTGTLTTGNFTISAFETQMPEDEFKNLVFSIEKYSTHPIARSISSAWKTSRPYIFTSVEEVKGSGMTAKDKQHTYRIISGREHYGEEYPHNLVLLIDGKEAGWIDISDEVRPEASFVINWLRQKEVRTILLSGDTPAKTEALANKLGIDEHFGGKSPAEKLELIGRLNAKEPTAMVGDGINDAPSLAKATVGISLSDASQLALQSSGVILVGKGLSKLPMALGLGKHTYATIRQNLFWAFFYNIIAIPVAAMGYLSPTIAAFAMGFSDVVLAANSLRLYGRKVDR